MSSFLNNVMFVQDYIVSQCNSFLLDSPADVAIATVQDYMEPTCQCVICF